MNGLPVIVNALGQLDNPNAPTSAEAAAHLNPSGDQLTIDARALAEHAARRREAGVGAAGERADTYPFVVDLRGVDQFRELVRLLERRGYRSERIEKVLGGNFLAYASRVWA
ncbi:membrane dipeptidase [Actinacidiphila glaucinigra]|uniref:Membrane dipeptidase n=1 Tax=Actinacidiphila glaucinigra TaxID=235986 RepID=A0A239IIR7_9ACTN|nr:membrane dipeptidase [Actinacidiphila glaucinigra]SNS92304.1 membrane dipeptidase [Actinacidiphila glaucinigra]